MISANFYPTATTYCDGAVECTANVNTITTDGSSDIAAPYYMGYLTYDDMPKMLAPQQFAYNGSGTNKSIQFYQNKDNQSWGFLRSSSTGSGAYRIKNLYYRATEGDTTYTAYNTATTASHQFFNKIAMCRYAAGGYVQLMFDGMVIPIADLSSDGSALSTAYTGNTFSYTYDASLGTNAVNLDILDDIINNRRIIMDGGITRNGTYHTSPDFYYSDFADNGMAFIDTDDNLYRIYLFISGFYVYYSGRFYTGQQYPLEVVPFIESTARNQTVIYAPGSYLTKDYRILIQNSELYLTGTNLVNSLILAHIPYEIAYQDLLDAGIGLQKSGIIKNTYILEQTGGSSTAYTQRFYPHYDLKDIYKYLMLYHKIDTQATSYATVVASDTYTTRYSTSLFDSSDTPLDERVTDDYQSIVTKLRPWQMPDIDITIDEYAPEDKPPYTPTQEDEGSNTGDDITRPTTLGVGGTNGFITQYSLTATQMAEIGNLLWLSFIDPDYYKNFLFALATTGTLNLSNLLDYFVSLRVYPFPLINIPSHAAAGNDMYIGAGIVPLGFTSTLHTINNYADYIDAGSCTIPRYYNDFRDLTHTQIMLYLPYCGTVQLNPADVVGGTLAAKYAIDFATGGCTAYVDLTTFDGRKYPIAVLSGSIGADVPLTASNAAAIAARIAGDALNFAGTVGEAISSDIGRSAQAIGSAATGDIVGAAIGVGNTYAGRIGGALDVAQTGLQIATERGVQMPMMAGGRGFGAFGAPQTAYVQIRRGIYAEGQQPRQGYKAAYGQSYDQPVQVSSCAGFTVFANVDTSGLQCDAMEREQVKKMMQAGIYI